MPWTWHEWFLYTFWRFLRWITVQIAIINQTRLFTIQLLTLACIKNALLVEEQVLKKMGVGLVFIWLVAHARCVLQDARAKHENIKSNRWNKKDFSRNRKSQRLWSRLRCCSWNGTRRNIEIKRNNWTLGKRWQTISLEHGL